MSASNITTSNLWHAAVAMLDPNQRAKLAQAKGSTFNLLASVREEAERKKNLCLRKRWKVQLGGKQIVLRDLFDKIISWVDEFTAIGDVVASFDPVHAALPWAGVRFLLKVVQYMFQ